MFRSASTIRKQVSQLINHNKYNHTRNFSSFRISRNQVNDLKDDSNIKNYSAILVIEKENSRFVNTDDKADLERLLKSSENVPISYVRHSSLPIETLILTGHYNFIKEAEKEYFEEDQAVNAKAERLILFFPISLILSVLLVVGSFLLTRNNLTEEEFEFLIEKARIQLKEKINLSNGSNNSNKETSSTLSFIWDSIINDIKRYPAIYGIVAINILAFCYTRYRVSKSFDFSYLKSFSENFTISPHNYFSGRFYSTISSTFMHLDSKHLYLNMLTLLVFGNQLYDQIGTIPFLALYFGGAFTSSIASIIGYLFQSILASSLGASGAVFAIIAAMLYLKDDKDSAYYLKLLLTFLVCEFVVVRMGFTNHNSLGHMSGALFGFVGAYVLKKIESDKVRRVELDSRYCVGVSEMKNFQKHGKCVLMYSENFYDVIYENGKLVEGEWYRKRSMYETKYVEKESVDKKVEEIKE